jgi:anaerobic magnesium-protoporphyrin IX monomethyl ester cyclase
MSMPAKTLILSPRLAIQKGDFLGSGVPYWPLEAATLASWLRDRHWKVDFLDLFGLDPTRLDSDGRIDWQGLPIEKAYAGARLARVDTYTCVFVYAISAMSHQELLRLVRWLKRASARKIIVFENSQAVTGYDLSQTQESYRAAGADCLLIGEPYENWADIEALLLDVSHTEPENIIWLGHSGRMPRRRYMDPVRTPVPAWDVVPFKNYWRLPYSHGPIHGPYFPMLTSRGCPYPCTFCMVPATNSQRWRPRPAEDVVDEMVSLHRRYGVGQFQWEDLNPTIDRARIKRIGELLSASGLALRFRVVSGTKVETLDTETLNAMAKGGCDYISISPESGSREILKAMRKPFNHQYGLEMIGAMRQRGISSQACFVLGHPQESETDRKATESYLRKIVRAGVSEAAFFILSPLPGSEIRSEVKMEDYDEALWSFSPRHRIDYASLERWRRRLIWRFLFWKLLFHPMEFCRQVFNALRFRPQTKMEMLPRRVLVLGWMRIKRWA